MDAVVASYSVCWLEREREMDRKGAAVAGVVSFSKAVLFALYVGLLFYVSKSLQKRQDDKGECTSSKSCPPHRRTFKARSMPLPHPSPRPPGSPQVSRTQQELTPADSPRNTPQQQETTRQVECSDDSASELVSSTTTHTSSLVYRTDFAESNFTSTSEQASSTSYGAPRKSAIKRERPGGWKQNKRRTVAHVSTDNEDSTIRDISIIAQDSMDSFQDIDQDISEPGSLPAVEVLTQSSSKLTKVSQSLRQLKATKQRESGSAHSHSEPFSKKVSAQKSLKMSKKGKPVISKDHLHQRSSSTSQAFKQRVMKSITAGNCRSTSSIPKLNDKKGGHRYSIPTQEGRSASKRPQKYRAIEAKESPISSKASQSRKQVQKKDSKQQLPSQPNSKSDAHSDQSKAKQAYKQVQEKNSEEISLPQFDSKSDADFEKLNSTKQSSTGSIVLKDQSQTASNNTSEELIFISKPPKPSKHRLVEEIPELLSPTSNHVQNENSSISTAAPAKQADKQAQKKNSQEVLVPQLDSKHDTDSVTLNSTKESSTGCVNDQSQTASKNTSEELISISKPSKPSKHRFVEEMHELISHTTNHFQNENSTTSTAQAKIETLTIGKGLCILEEEGSDDDNDAGSRESSERSLTLHPIGSRSLLIEDISPVRHSPLIQEMSGLLDKDLRPTEKLMFVREEAAKDLLFDESETCSVRSSNSDCFQRKVLIGEISPEKSLASDTKGRQLIEEISMIEGSSRDVLQVSFHTGSDQVELPKELTTKQDLPTTIIPSTQQDVKKSSCLTQETSTCMAKIGIQIYVPQHEQVKERLNDDKILQVDTSTEKSHSNVQVCVRHQQVVNKTVNDDDCILHEVDTKLNTAEGSYSNVQTCVPQQQVSEKFDNSHISQMVDSTATESLSSIQRCVPHHQVDKEVSDEQPIGSRQFITEKDPSDEICMPHPKVSYGMIFQEVDKNFSKGGEYVQVYAPHQQVNKKVDNGKILQEVDSRLSTAEGKVQRLVPLHQQVGKERSDDKILQDTGDRLFIAEEEQACVFESEKMSNGKIMQKEEGRLYTAEEKVQAIALYEKVDEEMIDDKMSLETDNRLFTAEVKDQACIEILQQTNSRLSTVEEKVQASVPHQQVDEERSGDKISQETDDRFFTAEEKAQKHVLHQQVGKEILQERLPTAEEKQDSVLYQQEVGKGKNLQKEGDSLPAPKEKAHACVYQQVRGNGTVSQKLEKQVCQQESEKVSNGKILQREDDKLSTAEEKIQACDPYQQVGEVILQEILSTAKEKVYACVYQVRDNGKEEDNRLSSEKVQAWVSHEQVGEDVHEGKTLQKNDRLSKEKVQACATNQQADEEILQETEDRLSTAKEKIYECLPYQRNSKVLQEVDDRLAIVEAKVQEWEQVGEEMGDGKILQEVDRLSTVQRKVLSYVPCQQIQINGKVLQEVDQRLFTAEGKAQMWVPHKQVGEGMGDNKILQEDNRLSNKKAHGPHQQKGKEVSNGKIPQGTDSSLFTAEEKQGFDLSQQEEEVGNGKILQEVDHSIAEKECAPHQQDVGDERGNDKIIQEVDNTLFTAKGKVQSWVPHKQVNEEVGDDKILQETDHRFSTAKEKQAYVLQQQEANDKTLQEVQEAKDKTLQEVDRAKEMVQACVPYQKVGDDKILQNSNYRLSLAKEKYRCYQQVGKEVGDDNILQGKDNRRSTTKGNVQQCVPYQKVDDELDENKALQEADDKHFTAEQKVQARVLRQIEGEVDNGKILQEENDRLSTGKVKTFQKVNDNVDKDKILQKANDKPTAEERVQACVLHQYEGKEVKTWQKVDNRLSGAQGNVQVCVPHQPVSDDKFLKAVSTACVPHQNLSEGVDEDKILHGTNDKLSKPEEKVQARVVYQHEGEEVNIAKISQEADDKLFTGEENVQACGIVVDNGKILQEDDRLSTADKLIAAKGNVEVCFPHQPGPSQDKILQEADDKLSTAEEKVQACVPHHNEADNGKILQEKDDVKVDEDNILQEAENKLFIAEEEVQAHVPYQHNHVEVCNGKLLQEVENKLSLAQENDQACVAHQLACDDKILQEADDDKLSTAKGNIQACAPYQPGSDYKTLQEADDRLSTAEKKVQPCVPHQHEAEEVGNGKVLQEVDNRLSAAEGKVQAWVLHKQVNKEVDEDKILQEADKKFSTAENEEMGRKILQEADNKLSAAEGNVRTCVPYQPVTDDKILQETDKFSTAEEKVQPCVPHQHEGEEVGNGKILQEVDNRFSAVKDCAIHLQVGEIMDNGIISQKVDNSAEGSVQAHQEQDGKTVQKYRRHSITIQTDEVHTPSQRSQKAGSDVTLQEVDNSRQSNAKRDQLCIISKPATKSDSSLIPNPKAARDSKSIQANFGDDISEKESNIVLDNYSRWKIMMRRNTKKRGLHVKFRDVRRSLASLSPPSLDCISDGGRSSGSDNSPRHSLYHACHTRGKERLGDKDSVEKEGSWYSGETSSKEKLEVVKRGSWYSM